MQSSIQGGKVEGRESTHEKDGTREEERDGVRHVCFTGCTRACSRLCRCFISHGQRLRLQFPFLPFFFFLGFVSLRFALRDFPHSTHSRRGLFFSEVSGVPLSQIVLSFLGFLFFFLVSLLKHVLAHAKLRAFPFPMRRVCLCFRQRVCLCLCVLRHRYVTGPPFSF